MEAAHAAEMLEDDAEPLDYYALHFWPAPGRAPDAVLRQTSDIAAYWHQNWGGAASE